MHPSPNPIPPAAACDHAGAERASAGGDTTPAESQPRPVTRGESSPSLAHIDWFACTFVPAGQGLAVVESVFLIPRSEWKERAGGWQGYTTRIDLAGLGILAYGGEHQRGTAHVELSGSGCARITDWNAVRVWCEACGVRLTRIDLAHDDFSGETVSIARALDWLARGEFNAGGRAPRARLIDDLGSGKGKTLNVGQRQNGKMCRVYEKGKQLGDPASPWCRIEVEFRGKSRELPYDLLVRASEYLAGAYPCLAYLSQRQDKVRTLRKTSEISYARLVECLRTQYGPALSTMLRVEGGDPFAVLEQASRPGTPKRLENLPLPSGRSTEGRTS
jgi:phage replication initiation protein